jgi:hypothetical protein
MYIRQLSYSSRGIVLQSSSPLSLWFLFLLICVLVRLGDRPVEPLSRRSRPFSRALSYLSRHTLPLLFPISTLAETTLDTPRELYRYCGRGRAKLGGRGGSTSGKGKQRETLSPILPVPPEAPGNESGEGSEQRYECGFYCRRVVNCQNSPAPSSTNRNLRCSIVP